MKSVPLVCVLLSMLAARTASAQHIGVNPTGVNVNSEAATVVFLTFGQIGTYQPVEALWCGTLIPAAPDVGLKCDPATIFGSLPVRYDRLGASGNNASTDIMTIPPSVARRAYQAAEAGAESRFFYVRHFVDTAGGPDQYVAVTCRLTGGGARVPLALTDVRMTFQGEAPVQFVQTGGTLPPLHAEIAYNGTGRLKGRWEVVLPGEELPEAQDLLTEATLPVEDRPRQRRYAAVGTFNVFLPPVGTFVLPGPDPARLPTNIEGQHLILLRVEASDDREGDSNLSAVGAGDGIVHSGAVAGFPLPPLRYMVGTPTSGAVTAERSVPLVLVTPEEGADISADAGIEFAWREIQPAAFYRLEVADDQALIMSAIVRPGTSTYRAPSWLPQKSPSRWRVIAFDAAAHEIAASPWRAIKIAPR